MKGEEGKETTRKWSREGVVLSWGKKWEGWVSYTRERGGVGWDGRGVRWDGNLGY